MAKKKVLPWADVCRVRLLCSEGWKHQDVASLFGLTQSAVTNIVNFRFRTVPHVTELSAEEYIARNSTRNEATGCLEWTGCRREYGYGRMAINGIRCSAHRFSWMQAYGCIPPGMSVLHHCDNPPCIEPAHLFLGANAENRADSVAKNRQSRGSSHGMAKIAESDVLPIRRLKSSGMKTTAIAKMYGIHTDSVLNIVSGRSWKHVPFEKGDGNE